MDNTILTRREFIGTVSKSAAAIGAASLLSPLHASEPTGTGYIYDDRMLNHIITAGHVECPERLVKIQERMKSTGLDKQVVPLPLFTDPMTYIKKIHTSTHIAAVQKIPNTCVATEVAVAGALGAAKAVCEGTVRNAFCAIRPPGHHAHNTGKEEGFCFYNNVSIAVKYVQEIFKIGKVLIIDWDYHHGNATQDTFYSDGTVLFFSTHNWNDYPQTGDPAKTGSGAGAGLNINVHLAPGEGDDAMKKAWNEKLLPKVQTFKPDMVFLSAGFDSRIDDIKGKLKVTDACFAHITKLALDIAKTYSSNRLVSLLEGGYNVDGTASATVTHVAELIAGSTGAGFTHTLRRCDRAFINNTVLYLPEAVRSDREIRITSANGSIVKTVTRSVIDNGKVYLNRIGLAAGSYYVTVGMINGENQSFGFVLTK